MNLTDYLTITDRDLARFEDVYRRYRRLREEPDDCEPMIIINTPTPGLPTWEERLADPMVMLKSELDQLRPHLEIGDDRVPTVRVQFGTAQVAAAFGCEMFLPTNNLPCAGSHALQSVDAVFALRKPSTDAGWYGKLWKWTNLWLENLPAGVQIQHPDIQSPFNTAHLVRGNDILLDFYDRPEAVERLLDVVTDFMVNIMHRARADHAQPAVVLRLGGDVEGLCADQQLLDAHDQPGFLPAVRAAARHAISAGDGRRARALLRHAGRGDRRLLRDTVAERIRHGLAAARFPRAVREGAAKRGGDAHGSLRAGIAGAPAAASRGLAEEAEYHRVRGRRKRGGGT